MSRLASKENVVLVVEDDELIRMHAVDMVRDLGFETIEAANSDDAISVLEKCADIDVIFTDIQMPGKLDGLDLVEIVRDRWPPIAVLVTSGRVNHPDLPAGMRFVAKPYLSRELKIHLLALIGAEPA